MRPWACGPSPCRAATAAHTAAPGSRAPRQPRVRRSQARDPAACRTVMCTERSGWAQTAPPHLLLMLLALRLPQLLLRPRGDGSERPHESHTAVGSTHDCIVPAHLQPSVICRARPGHVSEPWKQSRVSLWRQGACVITLRAAVRRRWRRLCSSRRPWRCRGQTLPEAVPEATPHYLSPRARRRQHHGVAGSRGHRAVRRQLGMVRSGIGADG